ncbi:hypothetical protein M3Y94_00738500 [Aphelenchoides besseyi]|nr:hypothetical protein M3Y94_00738500 [Aphelenchoides besseyi]
MKVLCLLLAMFVCVCAQQMQQQGSQNSSQPTIQSLSRPSNNNNNQCPRFWRPVKNSQNQDRCIPNEDACRGTSDFQTNSRCNNPCSNFQRNCPRAAICFTEPCDPCAAIFLDQQLNRICENVNTCGRYERPIRNNNGQTKCVSNPGSTRDDTRACCLRSPCDNFRNVCRDAAQCIKDACNECLPRFYDRNWNEVCTCRN